MKDSPFINKLERRFGEWAVSHLTLYIIAGQVILYFFVSGGNFEGLVRILLIPSQVFNGEIWRLFTFVFIPPFDMFFLWAFFYWYIFWLFGSGLEEEWGRFKFNLFLLNGYLLTAVFSFVYPDAPAQNLFVPLSVEIAFAIIYPNFEILIFFALPVKVKWIGLITAVWMAFNMFVGHPTVKPMILAAFVNLALFFWDDIWYAWKAYKRREKFKRDYTSS